MPQALQWNRGNPLDRQHSQHREFVSGRQQTLRETRHAPAYSVRITCLRLMLWAAADNRNAETCVALDWWITQLPQELRRLKKLKCSSFISITQLYTPFLRLLR